MRRIAVYRDGSKMAAQIGPGWVESIAGFGDTVADALRDLAYSFADHGCELRENSVGVDVAGEFIEVAASPGQSPADVLLELAGMIEDTRIRGVRFPGTRLAPAGQRGARDFTRWPSELRPGPPRDGGAGKMDLAAELQRIYFSEINVEIGWFWDGGIDVRLGDKMNGYLAEENVTLGAPATAT